MIYIDERRGNKQTLFIFELTDARFPGRSLAAFIGNAIGNTGCGKSPRLRDHNLHILWFFLEDELWNLLKGFG